MTVFSSLHHLGIATADIEETVIWLKDNFEVTEVGNKIFDQLQNAYLCMVKLDDGTKIELISGDIVQKFVSRNVLLYHSCWLTDNINSAVEELKKQGAFPVSKPKPAILFNGRMVCFMQTKIGLVELLEK